MKIINFIGISFLILLALMLVQCIEDDRDNAIYQDQCNDGIKNGDETGIDCGGSRCEPCDEEALFAGTFVQEDQMGRPSINILFNRRELRDSLNMVQPHLMAARFKEVFEARIKALDTSFSTNVLGLDASQMAAIFSADVLWVAASGPTAYDDGNTLLTGRKLGEDVMDSNLLWLFGGPDGTRNNDNPLLISDGVDENDADYLDSFPYLAEPFK